MLTTADNNWQLPAAIISQQLNVFGICEQYSAAPSAFGSR